MSSQTDLDQGGTNRQWQKTYMGPSVGWVMGPLQNILPVSAAGTYTLDPSTTLVEVSVAGPVTIVLPAAGNPSVPAGALPGRFVDNPVTIVDVGGNAAANNITINPAAGDTVMGLASVKIGTNYGGYTLAPIPAQRTWTSISP
jgi:hypothetical protein